MVGIGEIRFTAPLRIGDVLTLEFDKESRAGYVMRTVRVEAIGADWVVVRDRDSRPRFLDVDPETLTDRRESKGGPLAADLL